MTKKKLNKGQDLAGQIVIAIAVTAAIIIAFSYNPFSNSHTTEPEDHLSNYVSYPDTVSIKVLNGTSIDYLASDVQTRLRVQRGEIIFIAPEQPENADRRTYTETIIVSHLEDLSAAGKIAELLYISEDNIVWELPPPGCEPEVDITIYLGRDLESVRNRLIPFAEQQ